MLLILNFFSILVVIGALTILCILILSISGKLRVLNYEFIRNLVLAMIFSNMVCITVISTISLFRISVGLSILKAIAAIVLGLQIFMCELAVSSKSSKERNEYIVQTFVCSAICIFTSVATLFIN
mgnify:CR=1 FL=1